MFSSKSETYLSLFVKFDAEITEVVKLYKSTMQALNEDERFIE